MVRPAETIVLLGGRVAAALRDDLAPERSRAGAGADYYLFTLY